MCTDSIHLHHILNFSKARGNKKLRKLLKTNPEELTEWICSGANVGRLADSYDAQVKLLGFKIQDFGIDHMREYIGALPGKTNDEWVRLLEIAFASTS